MKPITRDFIVSTCIGDEKVELPAGFDLRWQNPMSGLWNLRREEEELTSELFKTK